MEIILASSSPYRKELMNRLRLPFKTFSPDIDETPLPGELPEDMVKRLAKDKALKALEHFPKGVCIGSDTVASFEGHVLGKPGNQKEALKQLKALSNKEVIFPTGVCVATADQALCDMVPSTVQFKPLSDAQILNYCELEAPYQSCGGFKSETTACALIKRLSSDDPTAIIGLPMIRLASMLAQLGVNVL